VKRGDRTCHIWQGPRLSRRVHGCWDRLLLALRSGNSGVDFYSMASRGGEPYFPGIAIYFIKRSKGEQPIWFEECELPLLSSRAQLVMRMRSAMDDRIEHPYHEIGIVLAVSLERVRAILNTAIRDLQRQRLREREETRRVARALPRLPGKAKVDVREVRDYLDRGVDTPWAFPEVPQEEVRNDGRRGSPTIGRRPPHPPPQRTNGPPPTPVPQPMFGLRWVAKANAMYLHRYGLVIPARFYSGGRTDPGDGRVSVLPAFQCRRSTGFHPASDSGDGSAGVLDVKDAERHNWTG
jgi:Sigma-70, region 4